MSLTPGQPFHPDATPCVQRPRMEGFFFVESHPLKPGSVSGPLHSMTAVPYPFGKSIAHFLVGCEWGSRRISSSVSLVFFPSDRSHLPQ